MSKSDAHGNKWGNCKNDVTQVKSIQDKNNACCLFMSILDLNHTATPPTGAPSPAAYSLNLWLNSYTESTASGNGKYKKYKKTTSSSLYCLGKLN